MAEEFDAGRIVAQIVLDTQQLNEGVDSAKDKLNELQKTNNTVNIKANADYETLDYVRGSLEELGITGQKASDIINAGFINKYTVQSYAATLEEIAAKIENCQYKIRDFMADSSNIDSSTVASYKEALSALEMQYDATLKKLDTYIAKKVEETQSYIEAEKEIEILSGLRLPEVPAENGLKAQSYADTIIYVREVLESLKITGAEADKIIENCFDDVSGLRGYQNQLEIIAQKLEQQRQLVAQIEAKRANSQISNASLDTKAEKEIIKLKELEARYDAVYAKQDAYVSKVVSNYQKQAAATEQATQKQEKLNQKLSEQQGRKDFTSSFFLITSSLRTFNKIAPDAVGNATSIIMQVNAIRRAMLSGASPALVWANVIVSSIGIAASFIVNEIEKVKQAEEEARKAAAQSADEYKQERENIQDLTKEYAQLYYKLNTSILTQDEEIDTKQTLCDLQEKIIELYGDEAGQIDILNGKIDENIEKIKQQNLAKANAYMLENNSEIKNAVSYMENQQTVKIQGDAFESVRFKSLQENIEEVWSENTQLTKEFAAFLNNIDGVELYSGILKLNEDMIREWPSLEDVEVKLTVNTADAKEKMEEIQSLVTANFNKKDPDVKKFLENLGTVYNEIINDEYEENRKIYEEYQEWAYVLEHGGEIKQDEQSKLLQQIETVNTVLENGRTAVDKYNDSLNSLSSAYKTVSEGGTLSTDTLKELIEQYPELSEYIERTGDLTLANGSKIAEVYKNERQALLNRLEAEKSQLEAQQDILESDEESAEAKAKIRDRLNEINAEIRIYNSELANMDTASWSDTTKELNSLASAYQTLLEGKQLDVDTTLELIKKYPELADKMNEARKIGAEQAKIFKELYEAKKNDYILTQQNALNEVETARKAVYDEIQNLQSRLTNNDDGLSAGWQKRIYELRQELQNLDEEAETYKATIQALKNLEINSSNESVLSEMKNLASAYQTLADGKKLDIDTTLELIDKYPELASAMAKAGDLGKSQADIFKTLFEAKKNDYILTQQSALDNIKAAEDESKAAIASITAEISAYGFKLEYLNKIAGKTAEIARLREEAEKYEAKIKALLNLNIDDYGGSGSGSDKNEALQEELKLLDHKKAVGQLTAQQELNWLNRINQTYSMNTDEKMDMEKRLYNVKKQLQEEAEQAAEDALNAEYKRIENLKSLGKLNTQQELAQLEQIRKKYKLNAEQAMELEIKLYNLKKELKQEEIDSLDTLADAVTEALKNKYKEQQEAEEKLIDESIENWQKWEDETTSAIQAEIDALDKLSETQESENARQEYEQKRQATELQLAYEKDDYNRKQLEKELNRLDKEEAQRLLEEQIKARKEELQAQIESVQETSSAAQEKLNAEKDAISKNYEELTKEFNLRAEAEKVIMQSSQKEMVNLIKSYAPEYNMAGQTLGEQLYEGMKSKVDNIFSYIAQIESYVDSYQRQMAATANAATDDFWASRTAYEKELASMSVDSSTAAKNVTIQQTVNFNQPVESPVETRRQLDRTSQALAQQIASGV